MKHHITFQGIFFTILILCSIIIVGINFYTLGKSIKFNNACEKANGIVVNNFICVKPGSIFDPTVGDLK